MQQFAMLLFDHFKQSPFLVMQKALCLEYSYKDLFYIIFYHQKATADPFLEEKPFFSELDIMPLSSLFPQLEIIQLSMYEEENLLSIREIFPND